jgi:ferric-dicitrate binding protein FerR (iron transport regulator)
MSEDQQSYDRDEAALARLVAAVGPRQQPSAAATAEVRAAVEAEWRRTIDARQQRRRFPAWAMAAGFAVAAVGAWLARPLYLPEAATVATLTRVVGDVESSSGDGRWQRLASGTGVKSGDTLRTGIDGRAAIELSSGIQLRLDTGTQLALNDFDEAALTQGAVYVDSGAGTGGTAAQFVLDTSAGDVRHLGTQYEARLDGSVLQVGVREGRVEVSGVHGAVIAEAGELLAVSGAGQVTRGALAPNASAWDWVNGITPPFSIDGRTVDEFLSWAGRETGRTVEYASPEAARQARSVTLNGTVEGLSPEGALAAVLATTSLEPTVADDRIRIEEGQSRGTVPGDSPL